MPTQKITMGRDEDTDYQMKLKAAQQGSDSGNNYMWGLQSLIQSMATAIYQVMKLLISKEISPKILIRPVI